MSTEPDLREYDVILANTSAGKDSQAMIDYLVEMADRQGVRGRVVGVHADLGREEWPGTKDLARQQVAHYDLRFEIVKKPGKSLLDRVLERGMWPDSVRRWCTSDFKRSPVRTLMTRLADEQRAFRGRKYRTRILNCMGMRAQESPKRAKLVPFSHDSKASNGRRHVDTWLPIHGWTAEQVWERIRASGVPHHPAYDLGMPRLSCRFCIFAPRAALMLSGRHNRELLDEYVRVEQQIGHSFRHNFRLADIRDALDQGEAVTTVEDWEM